jgi:hypothetical protein
MCDDSTQRVTHDHHLLMIATRAPGNAGRAHYASRPIRSFYNKNRSASSVRTMSSSNKKRLGSPLKGIRFSPKAATNAPLYPSLNLSRFIHATVGKAMVGNGCLSYDGQPQDDLPATDASAKSEFNLAPEPELDEATILEALSEEAAAEVEINVEADEAVLATPPVTTLPYSISSDLFHAARKSAAGTSGSFWSHTMYEQVADDGSVQKVKVHYCTSKNTMETVCQKYFMDEKVLGFDLEWSPFATRTSKTRDAVSVIQIASPSRIAIFHLAIFAKDDFVAPSFKKIMEDPEVTKTGINISGDCTRLRKHLDVHPQGVFELSHLYKLVKYSAEGCTEKINKSLVSMATQVHEFLHLPLYKGDNVRASDWTRPLNQQQIKYSASDAYAGIQLFYVLDRLRGNLQPVPPRPHHHEKGLPIRIAKPPPSEEASEPAEPPAGALSDTEPAKSKPAEVTKAQLHEATASATTKVPPARARRPTTKPAAKDSRIVAAETSIQAYYNAPRKKAISVGSSSLRAYYIWHANADLQPEAVAKLLRDPPLKTNTVITYILDAIVAEKLPYDKSRLNQEVLCLLQPKALGLPKYRSFAQDYQAS